VVFVKHINIDEFDRMGFLEKMKYLYSVLREPYSGSDSCFDAKPAVEKGCDYFLENMERRMDEKKEDYLFDFDIVDKKSFEKRFGNIDGVCTKNNEIHLNKSVLRDPSVYGGATLFHERITKGIKTKVGQLVPVLEECLVNRALMITLGAYEKLKPSEVYEKVNCSVNGDIEKIMSGYKGGEKFQQVFNFIASQDEKNNERKIISSYI
jgi:hypothetical protein